MEPSFIVREARSEERARLGQLLVDAYAALPGFPSPAEQPRYYAMLRDVGALASRPATKLFVAASGSGSGREVLGGVVYIADMAHYGAGGEAPSVRDASAFRLLATSLAARGRGVGKALAVRCIEEARARRHAEVVLHTTKAMSVAWGMYERLGFRRSPDLDFDHSGLLVFGFRLALGAGGGASRHALSRAREREPQEGEAAADRGQQP